MLPPAPQCSFSAIRAIETLPVKSVPAAAVIPVSQETDENALPGGSKRAMHDKSVSASQGVLVAEDSSSEDEQGTI